MRIGQLAKAAHIHIETIRFYERKGLIEQPEKPLRGFRDYPAKILDRILFIKRAQKLGFTLEEIASLLLLDSGKCPDIQDLAEQKLHDIRDKLADLSRIEIALDTLVSSCKNNDNIHHCPIIDALLTR